MSACQIWIFFLFGCGGFMDGWSRASHLRRFTAVYKWRSAAAHRGLHTLLWHSDKSLSWWQTSKHKHTHAFTQQQVKQLYKTSGEVRRPHVDVPLCCVCIPPENPHRKTYSLTHPPERWAHINTHMATIQFLLCCRPVWLSLAGRVSSLAYTAGGNTGSPNWAVLNEPALEPMTY